MEESRDINNFIAQKRGISTKKVLSTVKPNLKRKYNIILTTKTQQKLTKTQKKLTKTQQNLTKTHQNLTKTHQNLTKTQQKLIKTQQKLIKTQQKVVKTQKNHLNYKNVKVLKI